MVLTISNRYWLIFEKTRMKSFITSIFSLCFVVMASGQPRLQKTKSYIGDLKKITDIMVFDVTSPVAAARYYAYVTLASYELLSTQDRKQFPSFTGISNLKLEGLPKVQKTLKNKSKSYRYALIYTAIKLLPSGKKLQILLNDLEATLEEDEIKYIEEISDAIVHYANQDGFLQLNNLKRYTPKRGPEFWQPTKPGFMAPVEPNWNTIKTFFIEKPDQFLTQSPVKFDLNKKSDFYKLTMEVRDIVNQNDKEKNEIAAFWDCNPYAISQIGHLEFGLKKISPGGHWMGIAGIACKKAKISIDQTIFTHTLLATSLHDAFVVCWDEKYRSNRVRPETVINQYIDKNWSPLLQTPPFPEFVSGHSVISTSSAYILTLIFGEEFSFRDTTEKEYGLKTRRFKSFEAAGEEACISRLYGGIHYMDAIDEGVWQGRELAQFIYKKTATYFNF